VTSSIVAHRLDPERERRVVEGRGIGGVVIFTGVVRPDRTRGGRVRALRYEAYRPLALRELRRLETEARDRWGDLRIRVVHRVGIVPVGETSVLVAVGAPHRAAAFAACRFLIDRLKSEVPIWKSDVL
jgi:molybdopterin synthase catalytic subunit